MTENEKAQTALQLMEIIDLIDAQTAMFEAAEMFPFEALNPQLWESLQKNFPHTRELLATLKTSIVAGTKVLYNDAAFSHLIAVVEAP